MIPHFGNIKTTERSPEEPVPQGRYANTYERIIETRRVTVVGCPACGGKHLNVAFRPKAKPHDEKGEYNHYGHCPKNAERLELLGQYKGEGLLPFVRKPERNPVWDSH